jgi:hypothetical protein
MKITDEMVDAAVRARKAFLINLHNKNNYERAAMREAIQAALGVCTEQPAQRTQCPHGLEQ